MGARICCSASWTVKQKSDSRLIGQKRSPWIDSVQFSIASMTMMNLDRNELQSRPEVMSAFVCLFVCLFMGGAK